MATFAMIAEHPPDLSFAQAIGGLHVEVQEVRHCVRWRIYADHERALQATGLSE
jgi:hypothetical protein